MSEPKAACPPTDADRRIIIIGGGYAGTTLAVRLGRALKRHPRPGVEVLLIENNPCQQALSELDLVAAGPERPEFCELWLPAVLKNLPVRTCFNRAESIDCARRVVTIKGGQEVHYWRLVIATGAVPSVPPVPGLAEHAQTMWSVADAQMLQARARNQMRLAAAMPHAEDRRRALSVTVCGGGATGVEIVGTLGQLLPKRAAYLGLDPTDLNIHLVEGRPDILYDLPEAQRVMARKRLAKLGVDVITGSMVASVDAERVVLADGREIPSAVLVWCGGAKSDPHASEWGFTLDNGGRIVTGPDGKADGLDDVYALGDVASFRHPRTNGVLPMLAQFAITSAEHATGNLLAELDGQPTTPFVPNQHGEFVSVGPSWGIGWMYGLKLSGFPAIFMKRLTYVLYWWQVGGIPLAWKRGRELLAMQR
jgi:NADH:ubiquinone reductase (H+-translocating)